MPIVPGPVEFKTVVIVQSTPSESTKTLPIILSHKIHLVILPITVGPDNLTGVIIAGESTAESFGIRRTWTESTNVWAHHPAKPSRKFSRQIRQAQLVWHANMTEVEWETSKSVD